MHLKDFEKFFDNGASFSVPDATLKLVEKSHQFLTDFSKDKIIYGINTGFGPMAQYKISKENQQQLQYNLVRSHATGQGPKLSDEYVRAVMLCRINTLSLGHSGVSLGVIKQLETYIQNSICPVIPEHG